jgi:hypothetical protein
MFASLTSQSGLADGTRYTHGDLEEMHADFFLHTCQGWKVFLCKD